MLFYKKEGLSDYVYVCILNCANRSLQYYV